MMYEIHAYFNDDTTFRKMIEEEGFYEQIICHLCAIFMRIDLE